MERIRAHHTRAGQVNGQVSTLQSAEPLGWATVCSCSPLQQSSDTFSELLFPLSATGSCLPSRLRDSQHTLLPLTCTSPWWRSVQSLQTKSAGYKNVACVISGSGSRGGCCQGSVSHTASAVLSHNQPVRRETGVDDQILIKLQPVWPLYLWHQVMCVPEQII